MNRASLLKILFLLVTLATVLAITALSFVADVPDQWKGLVGRYERHDGKHILLRENQGTLELLHESKKDFRGDKEEFRGVVYQVIEMEVITETPFSLAGTAEDVEYHMSVETDARGFGVMCWLNEELFERIFYGPELGIGFRIEAIDDPESLRQSALDASPPSQPQDFRQTDLVNLEELDIPLIIDIKYATEDNFMGIALYPDNLAFLQRPAAEALEQAGKTLEAHGIGLVVYDAYRPWYVTRMFWDATPLDLRGFVANPAHGSRHNRGCAVDLGLYWLDTGEYLEMPSGFDEFSERAYPDFPGGMQHQRDARDLLIEVMSDAGFSVYEDEWWHFDFHLWREYPIINIDFDKIP